MSTCCIEYTISFTETTFTILGLYLYIWIIQKYKNQSAKKSGTNHFPFGHFLAFLVVKEKILQTPKKKTEKRPDKYLSLIIDGMDQSKTHLPHWIQKSKVSLIIIWTKLILKAVSFQYHRYPKQLKTYIFNT